MIEIQSLVSTAVYGTPQRSTTGYNAKRLNMILAVLEKGPFSGLPKTFSST
jgi:DNA repair protein RadA/Sms